MTIFNCSSLNDPAFPKTKNKREQREVVFRLEYFPLRHIFEYLLHLIKDNFPDEGVDFKQKKNAEKAL